MPGCQPDARPRAGCPGPQPAARHPPRVRRNARPVPAGGWRSAPPATPPTTSGNGRQPPVTSRTHERDHSAPTVTIRRRPDRYDSPGKPISGGTRLHTHRWPALTGDSARNPPTALYGTRTSVSVEKSTSGLRRKNLDVWNRTDRTPRGARTRSTWLRHALARLPCDAHARPAQTHKDLPRTPLATHVGKWPAPQGHSANRLAVSEVGGYVSGTAIQRRSTRPAETSAATSEMRRPVRNA